MVDFSVFDSILDCAFVVDADGKVVYCNEPAAAFCRVSIRRVVGKANIHDLFTLTESGLLPFGATSRGFVEPTPFIETEFAVPKAGHVGTCQLAVRPLDESHWIFIVRDVTLEAALHAKYRSELGQKEEYARNLEKLVEARTAELRRVNATLGAILDSLGQGFFTFDAAGACGSVFTKACETVLGQLPAGRGVSDVLGLGPHELAQFIKWSETLFGEFLPFDDLRTLGPGKFVGPGDRPRDAGVLSHPAATINRSPTWWWSPPTKPPRSKPSACWRSSVSTRRWWSSTPRTRINSCASCRRCGPRWST